MFVRAHSYPRTCECLGGAAARGRAVVMWGDTGMVPGEWLPPLLPPTRSYPFYNCGGTRAPWCIVGSVSYGTVSPVQRWIRGGLLLRIKGVRTRATLDHRHTRAGPLPTTQPRVWRVPRFQQHQRISKRLVRGWQADVRKKSWHDHEQRCVCHGLRCSLTLTSRCVRPGMHWCSARERWGREWLGRVS